MSDDQDILDLINRGIDIQETILRRLTEIEKTLEDFATALTDLRIMLGISQDPP